MYAVFVMEIQYSEMLFDLRLGRLSAKALQIGGLVMVVSVAPNPPWQPWHAKSG